MTLYRLYFCVRTTIKHSTKTTFLVIDIMLSNVCHAVIILLIADTQHLKYQCNKENSIEARSIQI